MNSNDQVLLIGASQMAMEYAKVLIDQKIDFITIGRSSDSAKEFEKKVGLPVILGGIESYIKKNQGEHKKAIVAVGAEQLHDVAIILMRYGVSKILLEKPGGLNIAEIEDVANYAKATDTIINIGYNRRFYSSVLRAQEIIKLDGGITSFNFEFTEWGHVMEPLFKAPGIKENWFLHNSTHVIDLAFYLGGNPQKMTCYTSGKLKWHSPAIFSGAGISETGALFSYQANWAAPGRWVIDVCTKKHRLIFKPMETLQIQNIGSVLIEQVLIDDHLDREYKPGLFLQTEFFSKGDFSRFCTIQEQKEMVQTFYKKMSGYNMSSV